MIFGVTLAIIFALIDYYLDGKNNRFIFAIVVVTIGLLALGLVSYMTAKWAFFICDKMCCATIIITTISTITNAASVVILNCLINAKQHIISFMIALCVVEVCQHRVLLFGFNMFAWKYHYDEMEYDRRVHLGLDTRIVSQNIANSRE